MVAQQQGGFGLARGGADFRRRALDAWSIDHKPTVDAPDDEFPPGALNPKWTVVNGSPGTVSLTATAAQGYDLYSRPSWCLSQPKNNAGNLALTQAYTLPDGRSIVAKIQANALLDGSYGNDDNWGPGISLTQSAASAFDANSSSNGVILVMFRSMLTQGWQLGVKGNNTSTSLAQAIAIGLAVYLRIARVGLVYTPYLSLNGEDWCPGPGATLAIAPSKLWYFTESYANMGNPPPIMGIDWLREGSNERRPW